MGRRWRGLRDGCGQREKHGKEGSTCPEVCQTVPHSTGVVLEYVRLGLEYRQGEDCRVHLGYTLRLQGRTSKDV